MQDELEQKLRLLEASITLFRDNRLSSQSLRSVLIEVYNYLENEELDKRSPASKKRGKEKEGK
jgi:hypothetical protein